MSDRQAEQARKVRVSALEKGGPKKSSLKGKLIRGAAVAGVIVGGAALGVAASSKENHNVRTPENVKDFLGEGQLYSYNRSVTLLPGTRLYNRPALEASQRPESDIITTNLSGNTFVGEIREGDTITIEDPALWFRSPMEGFSRFPDEVRGLNDVTLKIDWANGWVIIAVEDPNIPDYIRGGIGNSETGLAATPIGGPNLEFINSEGETHIIPSGADVKPLK